MPTPAPGLVTRPQIWDLEADAKARPVPYAELPAEHLKAFQKTLDYYRKLRRG